MTIENAICLRSCKIEYCQGHTKITNDTEYMLLLNMKPKSPKRKIVSFNLVSPNHHIMMPYVIPLEDICITFEK